jgi:hypothetical protein
MPETCKDIYDNKSQLLHQVGTSRHLLEEIKSLRIGSTLICSHLKSCGNNTYHLLEDLFTPQKVHNFAQFHNKNLLPVSRIIRLVFVMKTEGVSCEVGNEILYVIQIINSLHKGHYVWNYQKIFKPFLKTTHVSELMSTYMAHFKISPWKNAVLFYYILFYSILFYSILFYSILFYSTLFHPVPSSSLPSCSILFHPVPSCSILFYSILFYSILFYSNSFSATLEIFHIL